MINKVLVNKDKSSSNGFTIVELIVVIVIISILAAITIVSYVGISSRAEETVLISDLSNSKKQIALYQIKYGVYPTGLDSENCPTNPSVTLDPDSRYCLKPSANAEFDFTPDGINSYVLSISKNNLSYSVDPYSSPVNDNIDWITIGTQRWARKNLNIGTMILGADLPTNNDIIEKYCYSNNETNCTNFGALYNWNEAMKWVITENAQGICPASSHIPSDGELKTLEMYLGMTQAQADSTSLRGTDEGTKLKIGGSSGFNANMAGYRNSSGVFGVLATYTGLWTSTQSGTSNAWKRYLDSGQAMVGRVTDVKVDGFSIRCIKN